MLPPPETGGLGGGGTPADVDSAESLAGGAVFGSLGSSASSRHRPIRDGSPASGAVVVVVVVDDVVVAVVAVVLVGAVVVAWLVVVGAVVAVVDGAADDGTVAEVLGWVP